MSRLLIELDYVELVRFREQANKLQGELVQMARLGAEGERQDMEAQIAEDLLYYARSVTPVWTGALKASHMMTQLPDHTLIHINPAAQNPFSPEDPPEYGPKVHDLSDDRAFYDRTVVEYGEIALEQAEERFVTRLDLL